MTNFAVRLKEERLRLGLSQAALGTAAGVSKDAQLNYEKGERTPNSDYLDRLMSVGVDVPYLFTGRHDVSVLRADGLTGPAPAPANDADAIYLPRLSATGSMGPGNEALDDVIVGEVPISLRWLSLHLPRCRPEALKLVHAHGDSMGDTLASGDFAFVDTDCQEVDVSGVYALEASGRLFIKRVTIRIDGTKEISSDNPNVRTVDVLDGRHPVRICGRVVYGWNGRRF